MGKRSPGILPFMKRVIFSLNKQCPPDVYAACKEACRRFRSEGMEAEVWRTGTEAEFPGGRADQSPDTLYVCDDPVCLEELQKSGLPVIALQHAGNAKERFRGVKYLFSEPDEVDTDSYVKAWQRLRGIPWDILETGRLRLRETTLDDLEALYEIYAMPGMTDYMEGLFPDPEDEKRYLRDYISNVYALLGFGVWTVLEKETGAVIGRCGFSVRNGFERIEFGFFIGTRWQGRGYAQEACSAALRYGRDVLGIETVQALVREGNEASLHVLEKLGFRKNRMVQAEESVYGRTYPGERSEKKPEKQTYILFVKETSNMVS